MLKIRLEGNFAGGFFQSFFNAVPILFYRKKVIYLSQNYSEKIEPNLLHMSGLYV